MSDEPSAGLRPVDTEALITVLERLTARLPCRHTVVRTPDGGTPALCDVPPENARRGR